MKILRNLLAATVVLSACDSGSPPTRCSTPPAQTLFTGAQLTVPVCFSDADGDLLVYQATSSDQDVIHVNANQNVLTLIANMPGQSTITVVASDPGGLTGELTFPVTVPNRDPEVVAEIGDQHILLGQIQAIDISHSFTDPDMEELAYSATSSDEAVAVAAVNDAEVTITAAAAGSATINVTATDASGGTATISFIVAVIARETIFDDDFSTDSGEWQSGSATYTTHEIADNLLHLWSVRDSTDRNILGSAGRRYETSYYDWSYSVEASFKADGPDGTFPGIMVLNNDPRYVVYYMEIGRDGGRYNLPESNLRIFIWDNAQGWLQRPNWTATVEEDLSADRFHTLTFQVSGNTLSAQVNDNPPLVIEEDWLTSRSTEAVFLIASPPEQVHGDTVQVNRVRLFGSDQQAVTTTLSSGRIADFLKNLPPLPSRRHQ